MAFSHDQLAEIPQILSAPRFATYLQHCNNDRDYALRLYQWNLEISSAFIVPLHVVEVSIRNAVVERLGEVHTPNWPWTHGFIRSLPSPSAPVYNPQKNLTHVAMREPTMGKVVAELKFVFWEKMFTQRHDARIWDGHINRFFPNAPLAPERVLRKQIHDYIFIVRELRNRIAHHEPIFSRNLQDDYNKMLELTLWRNAITADWMNNLQSVTNLLMTRP